MKYGVAVERTDNGYRVVVSRRIDAPAVEVWEALIDTEQWPEWGPSLTEVQCSERFIEEGAAGRIRTIAGNWLPFDITAFAEYYWSWRVGPLPPIGHRVDIADHGCIASFEIPPIVAPYAVVCVIALSRIARLCEADPTQNRAG